MDLPGWGLEMEVSSRPLSRHLTTGNDVAIQRKGDRRDAARDLVPTAPSPDTAPLDSPHPTLE
jgi:hypothetical protein